MSEWQDISTAPKDGRSILLFGGKPDSRSDHHDDADLRHPVPVVVGWWNPPEFEDWNGYWRYASYDGGYYGEWEDPTHWKPLGDDFPQ